MCWNVIISTCLISFPDIFKSCWVCLTHTHTHTHTHTPSLHSSPGDSFLFQIFFFFWCGPFLKSLLNLLQFCFCCFCSVSFVGWGRMPVGILTPPPGIKPAPPALAGERLTTGSPGKSPPYCYMQWCKGVSCLVRVVCCIFRNFLSSSLNTVIIKHFYHVNLQWHRLY